MLNDAQPLNDDQPVAERLISDVETLKALSDPVRLRILEVMVSAPIEGWTVKRLATTLGVGPTKLYHHVGILEERGLIVVAGTRVVSGIIETSYRTAQLSLRLAPDLLAGGAGGDSVEAVLATIFDSARADVARGLRTGTIAVGDEADPHKGLVARGAIRLDPARALELRRRLRALLDEFDRESGDPGDESFGFLLAFYPQPDLEPGDEETPDD